MVEKVNYLLHSYTTCHHVFYSYDSLLILFPNSLWRSEFVSLRTSHSLTTTYHVVLTFFLVLWYDWMLKLYGKKEREKSEHSTTFHLPEYNSTTSSASASGNVNNTSGALGLGEGSLVKVLNNTLFRLLSTAQAGSVRAGCHERGWGADSGIHMCRMCCLWNLIRFSSNFFSPSLSLFFRSYHVFTQATCSPLEII